MHHRLLSFLYIAVRCFYQSYLKDTFNIGVGAGWLLVQGGTVGEGCEELVERHSLHFPGRGQRQAITTDLDLRNARFIQYTAMIGGSAVSPPHPACKIPKSRNDSVLLDYSTDGGITWEVLHLLDYADYWVSPRSDYIPLPLRARTERTRVRWWQLAPEGEEGGTVTGWALEDVYIGGTEINPSQLYADFQGGAGGEAVVDETAWEFYPSAAVWGNVCGRGGSGGGGALTWQEQHGGVERRVTTGQLIVQDGYMMQFKLVVGCGSPVYECDEQYPVVLQYNKSPTGGTMDHRNHWEQVYPRCLLRGHETNMECRPYRIHQGTVYSANQHAAWTRVSLMLPPKTFSSETRFRWVQAVGGESPPPMWAVDDVYIGEACPAMCSGRGDCVKGRCNCDPGYYGERCSPVARRLARELAEGFEAGVSASRWQRVDGGGVGLGCGSLHPLAHGKTLYFSQCGARQAITAEMDVTKASKVMFVLQIGSAKQTPTCNVNLSPGSTDGTILLQYSLNKGIEWKLLATHEAREFLRARRVGYEIPHEARHTLGVQFRWWQPQHRGKGKDQWALDQVEIIMSRHDHMLQKNDVMSSLMNNH